MEIGWMLFFMAVSMAMSYVMAPDAVPPKPAGQDEFDFPQVDEGTPQAVYFGETWSNGWMVLGLGNFRVEEINGGGSKK